MDIFWQITLVEALLNVAIFAVAVICYGLVKGAMAQGRAGRQSEDATVGTIFGVATAMVLALPIHIGGGAAIGCQSILIAFAGALAGALGAAAAVMVAGLIIAVSVTMLGAAIGLVDVFAIVGAAAAGLVAAPVQARRVQYGLSYVHLPVLAFTSTAAGLLGLFAIEGVGALSVTFWPALASNLVATGVVGTLLLHEARRDRAERDIRISEASLREANRRLLEKASELKQAWDKAEELSRAKSEFLAMMSHELRTPLNAVIGFAQIIRDKLLGVQSDHYFDYAADIAASGEHLLSVINDILDFSRAEAGSIELADEAVDLACIMADCRRMLDTRAAAKQIRMESRADDHLPLLRGDERRVRQILLNLLSNALKFTPSRGQVRVGATERPSGEIELSVEDTGIGIPESDLRRVLDPFYQVDSRLSRSHEGTGLGLPLSKHLAELHDATLSLSNRNGGGLIATVLFPPSRVATPRAGQWATVIVGVNDTSPNAGQREAGR
jgi:signal transduction histidine kinase